MSIIPYGKHNITQQDIDAVIASLQSDFLTQGPAVEEFESAFAAYIGCKYAVAVSNGTAALHLSAMVMGVDETANVITTPITFAASANCIRYCNGNVWFADIDPDTYTLDIAKVEELILSKPEGFFTGIIPVHLAGYVCDMEAYRKLADRYNLWIIEDACHAPGGFFTDSNGVQQNCGNGKYAELSIFSFHPVKHIACGEGGMITTNDPELYRKLLLLRTHGITRDTAMMEANHGGWYYELQELGYNYRLTDFQAALGKSQLERADEGLKKRREIARKYDEKFADKPYIISQSGSIKGHAYHLYIICTENRKELYDFLRQRKVYCQIHYIPVHTMPYYRQLSRDNTSLPVAEQYYGTCLSLPMFPTLTDSEQDFVVKSINEFYEA